MYKNKSKEQTKLP